MRNKFLVNLQPGKMFEKPTRDVLKEEKGLNSTVQKSGMKFKIKNRFLKQSSHLMIETRLLHRTLVTLVLHRIISHQFPDLGWFC